MTYFPDQLTGGECSSAVQIILNLISGLGWVTVYILCIYIGFKHKTYCIPWVSLCINYAWELYFSVAPKKYDKQTPWHRAVAIVWSLIDTVIVIQLIIYGFKYVQSSMSKLVFYANIVFVFSSALTFIILFNENFDPVGAYSAFGDNYLMSILFIKMFYDRRKITDDPLQGQSIWIAICKCIGTLGASITWGVCQGYDDPVIVYMYVMITLLDLTYIGLLVWEKYFNHDSTSKTDDNNDNQTDTKL